MARFRVVKYRGKWYAQKRLFPFGWRCICSFGRKTDCFKTLRYCHKEYMYGHESSENAARTIERHLDMFDHGRDGIEAVVPVSVIYKPKEAAWPENE